MSLKIENRINVTNPISVSCLQKCWLDDADNVSMFNLESYENTLLLKMLLCTWWLNNYVHNKFQCTVMSRVKYNLLVEYLCVRKYNIVNRNPKSMCYAMFTGSQMKLSMIWVRLPMDCLLYSLM